MADLRRRLAAEALGTGLLVATVVGSGIMAERLTADAALALLGNTLPTAAILIVLITILAPISGAHLNPALTLVMALRRDLAARDAALYVVAQIAGAVAGTFLAHLMFETPVFALSTHVRTGWGQWLAEGVACFGLVLVILGGIRVRPVALPWLVGLTIAAAYWFTASTSFANPAVTIARALTDSFSGIRPLDAPAFILAQVTGALFAMAVARWLWSRAPGGSSARRLPTKLGDYRTAGITALSIAESQSQHPRGCASCAPKLAVPRPKCGTEATLGPLSYWISAPRGDLLLLARRI